MVATSGLDWRSVQATYDLAVADQTVSDQTTAGPPCSKCGEGPAGPGGILCGGCLATISAQKLSAS
jgi:hypothetical protein